MKVETPNGPIFSSSLQVKNGVPQGSILGPLLFIIFVNDLPKYLNSPAYLFADDTSAVVWGKDALLQLTKVYRRACNWFHVNGLSLNEEKTQLISYSPSVRIALQLDQDDANVKNSERSLMVTDSVKLNLLESAKILGVLVDQNLNWRVHVMHLVSKLQQSKWALRNLVKIASPQCALLFYHAHIVSHIRYGIILWGRSESAKLVAKEHFKIIKILFNKSEDISAKSLLVSENLFSVASLYILECLKYAYLNGLIKPSDFVPPHSYECRHNFIQNDLITYKVAKNNVKYAAIQLLNGLPLQIKNLFRNSEIGPFFAKLENFLLEKAYCDLNEFLPAIV